MKLEHVEIRHVTGVLYVIGSRGGEMVPGPVSKRGVAQGWRGTVNVDPRESAGSGGSLRSTPAAQIVLDQGFVFSG